jgi:predicted DNA-binding transcriptional regulator YafY
VLSYGTQIEVLEPPELRELVVRSAEAIVAFYAGKAVETVD